MSERTHCLLPWRLDGSSCRIEDSDGEEVADCARTFGLTDFANAAFIVRACNAHDEMLEALEELDRLRVGCSPDELGAIAGKTVAAFVEQYRAAIAKATA